MENIELKTGSHAIYLIVMSREFVLFWRNISVFLMSRNLNYGECIPFGSAKGEANLSNKKVLNGIGFPALGFYRDAAERFNF